MSLLIWPEKEKTVIELYKKKVSPKEIASQLHMSLRDVYKILKKEFGQKEEFSNELKAVILFRKGKKPVDVAIKLKLPLEEASRYYMQYKESFYLGKFGDAYRDMRGKLKEVSIICDAMQTEGMKIKDMISSFQLVDQLAEMESRFLNVAKDLESQEEMKNVAISQTQEAKAELARVNSLIMIANAELTRVVKACQNYNANSNNSNYYNPYAPNRNPYWSY